MRAANSWLGPDGQRAAIAGGRGVFCEKGLHGPVAADHQGNSYVQQLACEEDRPFSRYLLNRAGRDCAAADEECLESVQRGPVCPFTRIGTQLPGHGPAGIKMGTGISVDTRSPNWRQTHDQRYSCNIRGTHRGDRLCLPGNGQWLWLVG